MKKLFIILITLTQFQSAWAKVSVQFHPYDPTLTTIAKIISSAKETVDIAVYNMDTTDRNPVVKMLKTEAMQERIQNGDLKIRMIFEGFSTDEKDLEKMLKIEEMGVDVRTLGSSKKMHHKFAVVDGALDSPYLVTGSANWSMTSRNNYNEVIMYFENELPISYAFQKEFNGLWNISKEVGDLTSENVEIDEDQEISFEGTGMNAQFNIGNFKVVKGKLRKDRNADGYILTKAVVEAIDSAESKIQIATTRIKLRPIYDALVRAAQRGVKIEIVVTMGQYEYENIRKEKALPECEDAFSRKCSSGVNFSNFLYRDDFEGSENIDLRLKFFHVKKAVYLTKQMHSKYMIVDQRDIHSGSFNWSYSAEYNHIENLVYLDGATQPEALQGFLHDFNRLWTQNRDNYNAFLTILERAIVEDEKINCGFDPMTLKHFEIDNMLSAGKKHSKSTIGACL